MGVLVARQFALSLFRKLTRWAEKSSSWNVSTRGLPPPSLHGTRVSHGPGPSHCPDFTITLGHTTFDRTPLDEWSARCIDPYVTTLTRERHLSRRRNSNPQTQQPNGSRSTPLNGRSLESATRGLHVPKFHNFARPCPKVNHISHTWLKNPILLYPVRHPIN